MKNSKSSGKNLFFRVYMFLDSVTERQTQSIMYIETNFEQSVKKYKYYAPTKSMITQI